MSSPAYATITVDRADAVATVTMRRPERRNALSPALDAELRTAFDELASDETVRAVVLAGEGRDFCSGADLSAFEDLPTPDDVYDHLTTRYLPLIETITTAPKPVLAAVNGSAAGAGCALALACDLRVMAEDARLLMAFSNIGLVPDMGASWLLVRQVGHGRAFEIAAEGAPVPAGRCLELGLTNRVVLADELLGATQAWAARLAERPTRALGLTKKALLYAAHSPLDEAIEHEAQLQRQAAATHDHHEGVTAFLEKRQPRFEGR